MLQHVHPKSGAVIVGMLLPPQTVLMPHDCYDSSTGEWENNPALAGLQLRGLCGATWVRPSGDLSALSPESRDLLIYLAEMRFLVALTSHWVVIPSVYWKNDGRMDWEIRHPECVEDFISRGFLLPFFGHSDVYEFTDAGREAARLLLQ